MPEVPCDPVAQRGREPRSSGPPHPPQLSLHHASCMTQSTWLSSWCSLLGGALNDTFLSRTPTLLAFSSEKAAGVVEKTLAQPTGWRPRRSLVPAGWMISGQSPFFLWLSFPSGAARDCTRYCRRLPATQRLSHSLHSLSSSWVLRVSSQGQGWASWGSGPPTCSSSPSAQKPSPSDWILG